MSVETGVLNRAKYTARDFNTLFDDVQQFIENRYGAIYNDFQATSQGVMLMDMLAHSLSQLHWYMDRRASEAYLDTCRRMSSASRLTRQQGYRMSPATSSSVELTVAPTVAPSFDVTIPMRFQFAGPSGLVFEATEEVILPAGSTAAQSISVREGETLRVTATSDGTPGQQVRLVAADNEETYVIDGSVEVYVDGVEWSEVDFLEFGENNQFEVHYHEEPPVVRFGNGVSGKVPDQTASIRIFYAINHGEKGNAGRGTITSVSVPLVQRFTTIGLTVTNDTASSGGADPESVEEARRNAPRWFGSRKRAVTQEDYRVLAGTFSSPEYGAIASANAFVSRTVEEDLEAVGYITEVRGEVEDYQATLSALTASAQAALASLNDELTTASAEASSIATAAATAISACSAVITNANSLIAQASFLEDVDETLSRTLTDDGEWAYDIDGLIAATSGAVKTDLTNNWKPALTAAQATVASVKAAVESGATSVRGNAGTADTQIDLIAATVGAGGTHTNAVAAAQARSAEVGSDLTDISTEVAAHEASVDTSLGNLEDHLTSILGADCKTNVITVPVLSFDGDGNYQAPSRALMNELERYLQGICDVAHVVNVVSGEPDLVSVSISVHLKQSDAYVFSEVASDIRGLLTSLLKKREFGVNLYLNRVYSLCESVTGVQDLDAALSADAGYMDDAGNVICPDSKVLVLGTLEILPLSE